MFIRKSIEIVGSPQSAVCNLNTIMQIAGNKLF